MAQIVFVHFETELIADAAAELVRAMRALSNRHGDQFRQIERRIEAVIDDPNSIVGGRIETVTLEPGREIILPAPDLRALLNDIRELGV